MNIYRQVAKLAWGLETGDIAVSILDLALTESTVVPYIEPVNDKENQDFNSMFRPRPACITVIIRHLSYDDRKHAV
jgi:hypothetical protein